MTVQPIPTEVIDGWKNQYNEDSELWTKYPEIDREEVVDLAEKDRQLIELSCLYNAEANHGMSPIYLATAGAPCSGKSTVLDNAMRDEPHLYGNMARVDPDRWGLLFMHNLYHSYLMSAGMSSQAGSHRDASIRAYDIARPASNYLTLPILNTAAIQKMDIAHGTTHTSPHSGKLMQSFKGAGYIVELLVVGANTETRLASNQDRINNGWYQATNEDIATKADGFITTMETYFTEADRLTVFWRDEAKGTAVKAAIYDGGKKVVLDQDALDSFTQHYEQRRIELNTDSGTELKSFEDLEMIFAGNGQAPKVVETPDQLVQPPVWSPGPDSPRI